MKLIYCLLALLVLSSTVSAQTVSLRGRVTDQNGDVIPAAQVTLNGPSGLVKTITADEKGEYSFADLPAGDYTVEASAPSFTLRQPTKITLKSGVQTLNLQLSVVLAEQ